VLTLISICRSIGCSFEEFDTICRKIAHPESQLVNPSVRVAAWTGWAGDRIRRENRDEFIRAYGGIPIVNNTYTTGSQAAERFLKERNKFKKLL
jgi:hypothetical protein